MCHCKLSVTGLPTLGDALCVAKSANLRTLTAVCERCESAQLSSVTLSGCKVVANRNRKWDATMKSCV